MESNPSCPISVHRQGANGLSPQCHLDHSAVISHSKNSGLPPLPSQTGLRKWTYFVKRGGEKTCLVKPFCISSLWSFWSSAAYSESSDSTAGGRMFGINLENRVGAIWTHSVRKGKDSLRKSDKLNEKCKVFFCSKKEYILNQTQNGGKISVILFW